MLFFRFLSRLPFWVLYRLADVLYFITCYVVKYRKKVILENLRNAFPEKSEQEIHQLMKGFYHNLCDIVVETLKLLTITDKELRKLIVVKGMDTLDEYHRQGKVILAMASHLNCWEAMAFGTIQTGIPLDVIYKPLSNKFFDKLMFTIRSRHGIQPVPMKQILREVIKKKHIPRIVGAVADQAAESPDTAYWTNFLHQETDFFMGTEKMARSFQYPIVYGDMTRVKRGSYVYTYRTLVEPPYNDIPLGAITEMYVRNLERSIQENPADWLWSHRRFKHKRNT